MQQKGYKIVLQTKYIFRYYEGGSAINIHLAINKNYCIENIIYYVYRKTTFFTTFQHSRYLSLIICISILLIYKFLRNKIRSPEYLASFYCKPLLHESKEKKITLNQVYSRTFQPIEMGLFGHPPYCLHLTPSDFTIFSLFFHGVYTSLMSSSFR